MFGASTSNGGARRGGGAGAMVVGNTTVGSEDTPVKMAGKPWVGFDVKSEDEFKGQGTDRHALKAQFEAHVAAKSEAAAKVCVTYENVCWIQNVFFILRKCSVFLECVLFSTAPPEAAVQVCVTYASCHACG